MTDDCCEEGLGLTREELDARYALRDRMSAAEDAARDPLPNLPHLDPRYCWDDDELTTGAPVAEPLTDARANRLRVWLATRLHEQGVHGQDVASQAELLGLAYEAALAEVGPQQMARRAFHLRHVVRRMWEAIRSTTETPEQRRAA